MVGYLAQRTALIQQLQLVHPEDDSHVHKKTPGGKVGDWELEGCGGEAEPWRSEELSPAAEREWTAWDICDGEPLESSFFKGS